MDRKPLPIFNEEQASLTQLIGEAFNQNDSRDALEFALKSFLNRKIIQAKFMISDPAARRELDQLLIWVVR